LSDSGAGWLAVAVSLVFIMICWRKWLIWVLAPIGGLLASAAVLFYDKTQWLRISFQLRP